MLNTRYLRRHATDVNILRTLVKIDILCLTISQNFNNDCWGVCQELNIFEIYFNLLGERKNNVDQSIEDTLNSKFRQKNHSEYLLHA